MLRLNELDYLKIIVTGKGATNASQLNELRCLRSWISLDQPSLLGQMNQPRINEVTALRTLSGLTNSNELDCLRKLAVGAGFTGDPHQLNEVDALREYVSLTS